MQIFADLPLTTEAASEYAAAHIGGRAVSATPADVDGVAVIIVNVERQNGETAQMHCWLEGGKLYGEW